MSTLRAMTIFRRLANSALKQAESGRTLDEMIRDLDETVDKGASWNAAVCAHAIAGGHDVEKALHRFAPFPGVRWSPDALKKRQHGVPRGDPARWQ